MEGLKLGQVLALCLTHLMLLMDYDARLEPNSTSSHEDRRAGFIHMDFSAELHQFP